MAFSDPITLTYNAVAESLPRVETDGTKSVYKTADGEFVCTISHRATKGGMVQRLVKLDRHVTAPDPFRPQENRSVVYSVHTVITEPADDSIANSDLLLLAKAHLGWLTDANVNKVTGGEH